MADKSGRVTLWGIEVFLAAADEKSISAAARRLGASPSSISQQLTNLETAVGAMLLNRNERPVSLTPAGEVMRRHAQVIVNEAAQARLDIASAGGPGLMQLRLGVIEDFDANVTPHLLREMAQSLTSAQFLLETGPSHRLFDQLDTRALDVVVAADLGAAAEWMEVYPLMSEPFVAVVPKGEGSSLAQLQALPLIQYTQRHHMGRQIADHLARQNLTLSHRFELDSYHAILAMVSSGAGWTILPPLGVMHATRFADMVEVHPLPFAPLSRTISLSARRNVLGEIPAQMATLLRRLLAENVIKPSHAKFAWLAKELVVQEESDR